MTTAEHESNPILREQDEQEVSPLELLFDLVFVLGVSQLTRHLLERASWRGAAETLVLYLPVFAVWFFTSWAATLYSLSHPRARRMVVAVMVIGLFLNASLNDAFTTNAAWVFAASLLVIQLGRTVWMLSTPLDSTNRDHFRRVLAWLSATAPLWIIGAALGDRTRLAVWGAAAAVDLAGTWLAHPVPLRRLRSERLEFGGEHLMERCRLFLLIALGETIVTPGTALARNPTDSAALAGGALAIGGTLCLWWLYFRAEPIALRHVSTTKDPVYASRMAGNGLLVLIAGLIALAAGSALVINRPTGDSSLTVALLLFGGPALFLITQVWYLRLVSAASLRSHLVAIAALAIVAGATLTAPALATEAAVVAVLSLLVTYEHRKGRNDDVDSGEPETPA